MDQGMNGRIYDLGATVKKIQKRNSLGHDILTQKRIHNLTERLVNELKLRVLRVPHVFLENQSEYEMTKIDTSNIIYLGDPNHSAEISDALREQLTQELAILWIELFKAGFAAWDYELYLQKDGSIILLDFDKFGFRMTSGPVSILLPQTKRGSEKHTYMANTNYFFQNPCFPYDFVDRLRALGFEPPADCLPTRKN